ncbi:unnamed protein product [Didymodactylos carnosus]|uniref:D-alanyl-D-alanine carboxypeptidase-like core domain-containing protein n=1 Tax=Didymodactylos carnosus TaxID=1234261 RepID=A0A8S2RAK2_9BILA|nr:unnamed protein product [Didymodactylos carnosus]CAF4148742.1 unnamed protein product [Didymodactylos carnosus]
MFVKFALLVLSLVLCASATGRSLFRASVGSACSAGGRAGTCLATTACSGTSTPGQCLGTPANIQCCTKTCTAAGKAGLCVATSACSGTSTPGLCPGLPDNVRCCVSGGGSTNGLCGAYAASAVSTIKGNGNVVYSVVKILQSHLVDSSKYSLGSNQADNTMTTTTACSFDKMRSAAAAAGATIKIASGFRTIERQQYFYNCYVNKNCNGGNLAAKPGTSNHGKGIALDLNTDCGSQTGAKPNCGGSKVYQWLKSNAHKYGFTRTVQSEPWHWEYRGAGVAIASYT